MLLSAICCYALAQTQTPIRKEGPPGRVNLAIYKEKAVELNPFGNGRPDDNVHGKSVRYDRLGFCSWKVLDGGIAGVPCRIYQGEGQWRYVVSRKNTAIKDFHDARYTSEYYVGMDGIPIKSTTKFVDETQDEIKTIDVYSEYASDHIDVTVTRDGVVSKLSHYPTFGMERFAGMFEPIMRSGLIQSPEMDCAVIHPYTGVPYEFKLKVRSRFTGDYFFLPQAGYCIEVDSSEAKGTAFLTRQGQLLMVKWPNNVEAVLESGYLVNERRGWGKFKVTDWDKSTDETNPERPAYKSLAIPVMFQNPKMLFAVPCALTD